MKEEVIDALAEIAHGEDDVSTKFGLQINFEKFMKKHTNPMIKLPDPPKPLELPLDTDSDKEKYEAPKDVPTLS